MSYDVIYTNKSLKQLKKLSKNISESIISSIDEIKI
jgi:mRNA interferase RelE/StbE